MVGGAGTIAQSGAITQITQSSQSLAINWDSFNVGASEVVQFIQPGAQAVALNRIVGGSASEIFGRIDANGTVFLINTAGVLFAETAQINVANLMVSGLDMSTEDFMNGNYALAANGLPGAVVNHGVIAAASGGSVALIGGQVVNTGLIKADYGRVTLAGAEAGYLDFDGDGLLRFEVTGELKQKLDGADAAVTNAGTIKSGEVIMEAAAARGVFDTLVNNEGIVVAAAIDTSGGQIRLVAAGGDVVNTGTLDASSVTGNGGSVTMTATGGDVVNAGLIDVSSTTGHAGTVTLAAVDGKVINTGTIEAVSEQADAGVIELAATGGNIESSGNLIATSVEGAGGTVLLESNADTLVTAGLVDVGSIESTGGTIHVLGNRVAVMGPTRLGSSGGLGGGTILIGGDFRGANPLVRNASQTYVGPDVVINADVLLSGTAGRVIVWSEDVTRFFGTVSARGPPTATGGFVEVSSHGYLAYQGWVDVRAGSVGTLLLDPTNVLICSSATGGACDGGTTTLTAGAGDPVIFSDAGNTGASVLTVQTLTAQLASANVTVTTSSGFTDAGNITVADAVTWASANSLTLQADNNIAVNAPITASGTGGLTLTGGAAGGITINAAISLGGGALAVSAGSITTTASGSLSTGAGAVSLTADTVALAAGIAGSGTVTVQPLAAGTSIGIGAGAGTLQLSQTEIDLIADGHSSITIGRADGTGAITISTATFNDPVTIRAPVSGGSIAVTGLLTGSGNAAITLDGPGATTTLSANIVTAGNAVLISDSVLVNGAVLIDTTNGDAVAAGTVTITGAIDGANANGSDTLTIDAAFGAIDGAGDAAVDLQGSVQGGEGAIAVTGGQDLEGLTITAGQVDVAAITVDGGSIALSGTNIDLNGAAYATTTSGSISFTGPVDLDASAGALSVATAGGGNVSFSSTLDDTGSDNDLAINAGAGAVTLGGAAGTGAGLKTLTVTAATASLRAVTTTGAQNYTGVTTTTLNGTLTVNTAGAGVSAGAVVLGAGSGTITLTGTNSANDVTLGTVNGAQALAITAGGGDIVLGAVGGTTPLTTVTLSGGTASLQAVTTTGAQNYTGVTTTTLNGTLTVNTAGAGVSAGAVVLGAGSGTITLTGTNSANDVTLGTVNGARPLAITAGGGDIVLGVVGGTTPLTTVTPSGSTASLQAVTTTGAQNYTGVTTTTLNGTLTINTAGASVTAGAVVLAAGGGAITLTGSSGSNDVTLGTVDGGQALSISAGGGDVVLGVVGGGTPVASVTVSASTASLQAVTSTGAQSYSAVTTTTLAGSLTTTDANIALGAATQSASVTLTAGTGTVTLAALTGGAHNLKVIADEINLNGSANSIIGTGAITFEPGSASQAINVGGADSGLTTTLDLLTTDLQDIADGHASITIGRADGTGTITVSAISFNDPITLLAGGGAGAITVSGNLTTVGNTGITLTAGGNVAINAAVSTGAVTTSTGAADTVTTGSIAITAGGTISGSGAVTTGAASSGGGANDTTTSGSITLNAGGAIQLSAADALKTGNSSVSGANSSDNETVGSITITSADKVSSNGTTGQLDVSIGAAGAGATITNGTLTVTTDGGAGDAGGIFITSGEALRLGAIATAGGGQAVTIGTTNVALTVTNATESLAGDTVTLTAGTNTVTIQDSAFDLGAGSLTVRANGIDFTGGANSIQGSGTVTLEPNAAGTTVGVGTGGGTLQLDATDIAALKDGFSSITIGRTDSSGTLTLGGTVPFLDNVTLQGGSITATGSTITGTGSVILKAISGDITDNDGISNVTASTIELRASGSIGANGNDNQRFEVAGVTSLTIVAGGSFAVRTTDASTLTSLSVTVTPALTNNTYNLAGFGGTLAFSLSDTTLASCPGGLVECVTVGGISSSTALNVSITTTSGNLVLADLAVNLGAAGGNIAVTATTGDIYDGNPSSDNTLTASNLNLVTTSGSITMTAGGDDVGSGTAGSDGTDIDVGTTGVVTCNALRCSFQTQGTSTGLSLNGDPVNGTVNHSVSNGNIVVVINETCAPDVASCIHTVNATTAGYDFSYTGTSGDIYVDAGAITMNGGDLELIAQQGGIYETLNNTTTEITTSGLVTLTAATGIGTQHLTAATGGTVTVANAPLDLSTGTLAASSTLGNILLNELDAVTLDAIAATAGAVTLTAGGDILDDADDTTVVSGTVVTLTSTGALGATGANNELDTVTTALVLNPGTSFFVANTGDLASLAVTTPQTGETNTYQLTSSGGGFVFTLSDGGTSYTLTEVTDTTGLDFAFSGDEFITVGTVTVGSGTVSLTSTGAAITDDGNDSSRITAGALTLAGTAIGGAAANQQIDTTVTSLTATASAGSVYVGESDGLTLTSVTATGAGNDVAVTSDSGDIAVTSVTAPDAVTLTATAGAVSGGNQNTGDAVNVTAASLAATAGAGSVTLDTNLGAGELSASATGGGVIIAETNGLAVGIVAGATGVTLTTTAGAISLGASSTITSSGGDILLRASDLVAAAGAAIDAGANRVTIVPHAGLTIDLGAAGTGNMVLDSTELDAITAGTLVIGDGTAGTISVNANLDFTAFGIDTLHLVTGGTVTGNVSAGLTVSALAIEASGAFTVSSAVQVDTLAINLSGAGSAISFTGDTNGFTIGTVDGVVGVRTADSTTLTSGGITLGASGPIVIGAAVQTGSVTAAGTAGGDSASSGSISITSAGSITGSGGIVVGNVVLDAAAGGADTAQGGSITISAASATPLQFGALSTGSATITNAAGGDETAVAGSLTLGNSAGNVGTDTGTRQVVAIGTASGADTNTAGLLNVSTDTGNIFIASGSGLRVGSVTSGAGTANTVAIATTAGDLVLDGTFSGTGTDLFDFDAGGGILLSQASFTFGQLDMSTADTLSGSSGPIVISVASGDLSGTGTIQTGDASGTGAVTSGSITVNTDAGFINGLVFATGDATSTDGGAAVSGSITLSADFITSGNVVVANTGAANTSGTATQGVLNAAADTGGVIIGTTTGLRVGTITTAGGSDPVYFTAYGSANLVFSVANTGPTLATDNFQIAAENGSITFLANQTAGSFLLQTTGTGDIVVNAELRTPDLFGFFATTGSISVTSGGSVTGTGAMRTGAVSMEHDGCCADAITSGSISVTATDEIEGISLITGDATWTNPGGFAVGGTGGIDTITAGSIALSGSHIGTSGTPVKVTLGVASESGGTGNTLNQGSISLTSTAAAGAGDVYVRTSGTLRLGALVTGSGADTIVFSATAASDDFLVLAPLTSGTLSGDSLSFVAVSDGTPTNNSSFSNFNGSYQAINLGGTGTLSITADSIDLGGTVTSGGGVAANPADAGSTIGLGVADGVVNLQNFYLSQGTLVTLVNAGGGTLSIGQVTSGAVIVNGVDLTATALGGSTGGTLVIATGATITDSNAAAYGFRTNGSGGLVLNAASGIGSAGNPLDIATPNLAFTNSTGGDVVLRLISASSGITLTTLSAASSNAAAGGAVTLAATGVNINTGTGLLSASNGPITLVANYVAGGGNLTVGSGGISSGSGSIALHAADNLLVNGSVTATGAGNVTVAANSASAIDVPNDSLGGIFGTGLISGNVVTLTASAGVTASTDAVTLVVDNAQTVRTAAFTTTAIADTAGAYQPTGSVTISQTDTVALGSTFRNQAPSGLLTLEVADGSIVTSTAVVSSNGGQITLTASDASGASNATPAFINVGSGGVSSGGGDVYVYAADDINLGGSINAGAGNVVVQANSANVTDDSADNAGAISRSAGTITGNTISLSAATGIGSAAALQLVSAASVSFTNTTSGDVNLTEASGLALAGANSNSGGNVQLIASDGGLSTGSGALTTAGGAIVLIAEDAGTNSAVSLTVGSGGINSGGGAVTLRSADNVLLSGPTSGGVLTVQANFSALDGTADSGQGSISGAGLLTGATSISLTAGDGMSANLATPSLTAAVSGATAGNITLSNAAPSAVTASLSNGNTNGGITYTQTGAQTLLVTSASAANGSVSLTNTGASLTVTSASAGGLGSDLTVQTITAGDVLVGSATAADLVTITSAGAIDEDGSADAGIDIQGATLDLNAVTGIGGTAAPEIRASSLSADTTGGAVVLNSDAAAAVTATSLSTGVGSITLVQTGAQLLTVNSVSTSDGSIAISNAGNGLTVGTVTAGGTGDVSLATTSAGNITLGSVNASGNDITVNAAGQILDNANDSNLDVLAATASLVAGSGIGASNGTVDLSVPTVMLLQSGTGGINVANAAAATYTDVHTTGAGDITVLGTGVSVFTLVSSNSGSVSLQTNGGNLTATSITANGAGSDVTLATTGLGSVAALSVMAADQVMINAATAITGGNGETAVTVNVIAAGLAATAANGSITLDTNLGAGSLSAGATDGSVSIVEANGLTVGTVSATGAGVNNVSLSTTAGDIAIGGVTAADDATLTAAGQINDDANDAAADVTAATATLVAGTGIGASNGTVDLSVPTVTLLQTGTGGIAASSLVAATFTNVVATGAGAVAVDGTGATLYSSVSTTDGSIALSTTGGDLTATTVTAAGAGADVALTATGSGSDVLLGSVTAPDAVTISAGGAIVEAAGDAGADVTAASLALSAGAGIDIDTDVATLSGTTGGAGDVLLAEASGVTVTGFTVANGDFTLDTAGATSLTGISLTTSTDANDVTVTVSTGDLTVGSVNAGTGGGDVSLTATAGAILNSGSAVTGDVVTLTARDGVGASGSRITTSATTLVAATTAAGPIWLNETDGVLINSVTTADGLIDIVTGGDTTLVLVASSTDSDANDITIRATAGNILVDLVDTDVANDNNVSGDISIKADAGSINDFHANPDTTLDIRGDVVVVDGATGAGNVAHLDIDGNTVTALGGTGSVGVNDLNGGTVTLSLSSGGDIFYGTAGTIYVDQVIAGGTVTLNSFGGSIQDDADDTITDIVGTTVILNAYAGIGGDALNVVAGVLDPYEAVEIESTSLDLSTGIDASNTLTPNATAAPIVVRDVGGTTLADLDTINGSITVLSDGDLAVADVHAGTSTLSSIVLVAAGAITDAGSGVVGTSLDATGAAITLDTTVGTLTLNSAGAVQITELDDVVLAGASSAGSLLLAAGGTITDGTDGDLAVTNNATLSGTAITLGNDAGNATNFGTLTFSGAQVSIAEDSDTVLAGLSTATDTLSLTSGGTITDGTDGDLAVTNNATLSGTAITLGNDAGNATNFGTLTFTGAQVSIVEDSDTVLAGLSTATDTLSLTSAGTITDGTDGDLAITNNATLSGTDITLGNDAGNATNFGTLTFSGAQVSIVEDSDTVLAGLSTATDTLSLTSAGTITDGTDGDLAVTNNATLSGTAITLGNDAGNATNFGTLTFTGAQVSIVEDSDTVLAGLSTATDTLSLTSAGTITDGTDGDLAITNNATLSGTAIMVGNDIGNTTNFGTLTFTSAGAVSISEDSDTVLAGASSADSLVLVSTGTITDGTDGDLAVTNNATLSGTAITLGNDAGNATNFGTLTFSGAQVSIAEDSDTVLAGLSTATDTLTLASAGTITDGTDGDLTVTNGATLTGTAITLGNDAGNATNFGTLTFTGAQVSIAEDSDTVLAGLSTATDTLSLTSAGTITDGIDGDLAVTNNATLSGTAITLGNDAGNATDFGTLTFTSPGAVAIAEDSDTVLAGGSSANSLVLTSTGTITDGTDGDIAVTNNATLIATGITLGDNGATNGTTFGSLTFTSTGAVSIAEDDATEFAAASSADSLSLTSAGAVTQTAGSTLTIANATTLTASGSTITLDQANDFNSVSIPTATTVVLNDVNGLVLGDVSVSNLTASAGGALTDAGDVQVVLAAQFSGTSINLGGAGENTSFNTVQFNSAGAVSIQEDTSLTLAGASTAGSLTLVATGIDDGAGTLNVAGATTLTASGANITLENGHQFSSVAVTDAVNVFLTDVDAIVIGPITTTTTGDLTVVAGGDISSGGALVVSGDSIFTANGAGPYSVTVNNAGNDFTGTVTFNGTGLVNVTVVDSSALDLAGADLAGNLDVTAAGITASGALLVDGTTTFAAGAGNDLILLAANDFGTVEVASANNVSLNDIDDVDLGNADVSGDLTLTADSVTSSGNVLVDGATSITADAGGVALGNANDFIGAVTIDAAGDIVLADVNNLALALIDGVSVTLDAGGTISDAEADGGTPTARGAGEDIVFTGALTVTAGAFGTSTDPIEVSGPADASMDFTINVGGMFADFANDVAFGTLTVTSATAVTIVARVITVDGDFDTGVATDVELVARGRIVGEGGTITADTLLLDALNLAAFGAVGQDAIGSIAAPILLDMASGADYRVPATTLNGFGFISASNFTGSDFNRIFTDSGRKIFVIANFTDLIASVQGSFITALLFTIDSSQFRADLNIFGVDGAGLLLPYDQCEDEESADCAKQ